MTTALITLVLSLPTAVERRATIAADMNALGIPFEFLDGVDLTGVDIGSHPDIDVPGTLHEMGRPMLPGEYGCALGHIAGYRRLLASDATHLLMLEDDAIVGRDLAQFVSGGHYARHPMTLLHHRVAWVNPTRSEALFDDVAVYPLANTPTMAAAYALNRDAAAALLARAVPIRRVADWPLDIPELDAWAAQPMPVGHPPFSDAAEQSQIGAINRSYAFRRPYHPMLSMGFLRRKMRQLGARKIS